LSNNKKESLKYRRARSRILVQVFILITIVIVLSGLATFFLLRNSQQRLIDESIDRLLQIEASNFSSSYNYIVQILVPKYVEIFEEMNPELLITAALEGELTEIQEIVNNDVSDMLDAGFLGLEKFLMIIPSQPLNPTPVVWASNDESLIYTWEIPDYLNSALENDDSYIWMEDGIPELGLEGEYLITLGQIESPFTPGIYFAYIGVKPMHNEIAAINGFFKEEIRSANLLLAIVLACSIALILLAIFLLLNFLIRKRITEPIDGLSTAAEEVMQGDLDVDVEVHEGGDFEGLERVFKQMVESFRSYIARSVGEEVDTPAKRDKTTPARSGRKRSRVLFEITAVVIVVMLIYGLATFFLIRHSQDRLIEDSIDRLVQTEAENFISSFDYATQLSAPEYVEAFEDTDLLKLATDLAEERISDIQREVNADIHAMVDTGFHGLRMVLMVAPPSQFIPEALVWASNQEDLIYNWEVPEYILTAIEEGTPYILMEDGIPELGLEDEYIITFNDLPDPLGTGIVFTNIGVKSMHEELAAINDFYSQERKRANLFLAIIILCTIALVALITFFFLNYLIRKQITRPVEELSAAAEQVMQGNFDVQVSVQEGEELESLKRAFNELVESFRKYIARPIEEE
jgi:methyl-accepting chemotaxis protein